jgi:hypothetical protein
MAGLTLFVALLLPAAAPAGWLSIRNDTKGSLVVQEVVVVNRTPRPGKLRQLYAGEVALENIAGPGVRRFLVFDPRQPAVPLYRAEIMCTGDDQFFSLQWETPPGSPTPPQLKLVSVPPPGDKNATTQQTAGPPKP